ncbi:hypothetical protein BU24DRAFT_487426 [Aaosphaeria arxii CBS 175.79]|uniref:Uncharacterized protein n=1 Tax=Aaosphaeria arxii CBS 175.79 TaxID=1450172 RepID=A0A6A5Y5S1_9PLEO|nr:uncharacterized protein BU24DRAFT_487426 [Aaosphaeria arxii CBS 175.79]KAF2020902.1 hypothetical protein BU24DRAFT_487426 [Aaosphaeria arxii CBS 175.79]
MARSEVDASIPQRARNQGGNTTTAKSESQYGIPLPLTPPGDLLTDLNLRQVLDLGHALRSPENDDSEVEQLRQQISTDRKELGALLQQRYQERDDDLKERNENFKNLIMQALAEPPPLTGKGSNTVNYPGTSITMNKHGITAHKVLNDSARLVKEYERLEKMVTRFSESDDNTSSMKDREQEMENIRGTLEMGRRVALRNVKKVLAGTPHQDTDQDDADTKGECANQTGGLMLGKEVPLDYTLANALQYAERGVKRMAKGLSQEEMDL